MRAWARELAWLEPRLAEGIGPAVRRLDVMLAGQASTVGHNEPDGYAGFSRRGSLDRLSLTDWLMSVDFPDELLRRAATSELLYLEPAQRSEPRRTRMTVIVDAGPSQLGPARLGQLAALVVLARRAAAIGSSLVLGVLGDPAGRWAEGDLPELLVVWLSARRAAAPTPEDVAAWDRSLEPDDEAWLFTGGDLAAQVGSTRIKVLALDQAGWSATGAVAVEARTATGRARLPLPAPPVAIRALRGEGLVRRPATSVAAPGGMELRTPTFPSPARRLLCRGDGPDELVAVTLPSRRGAPAGRPRRHRLPGPVVAASFVGSRLVALVDTAGRIRPVVIGKALGRIDDINASPQTLGLTTSLIQAMDRDGSPIGRLCFDRGDLLVEIRSLWWRMRPSSADPEVEPIVAVTQGRALDVPATARWVGDGFLLGNTPAPDASRSTPAAVFGGDGIAAYLDDQGGWRIAPPGVDPVPVGVEAGSTVLGLATIGADHWLVVRSPGGHILRLVRPGATRTLTDISVDLSSAAVHPRLPLVAVSQRHGTVLVADLAADEVLLRLRGQP